MPGLVRLGERVGDLHAVAQRLRDAETVRRDDLDRAFVPATYSMTMKSTPRIRPDVVDRDDVGMVQGAGGLGFLNEAALSFGIGDSCRREGP